MYGDKDLSDDDHLKTNIKASEDSKPSGNFIALDHDCPVRISSSSSSSSTFDSSCSALTIPLLGPKMVSAAYATFRLTQPSSSPASLKSKPHITFPFKAYTFSALRKHPKLQFSAKSTDVSKEDRPSESSTEVEAEADTEAFDKRRLEEKFAVLNTGIYECRSCGYLYNEAAGDPSYPIPPGLPFDRFPEDWRCPTCGAAKTFFSSKSVEIAGFAQNQQFGLGGNTLTSGQKAILIYGSLLFFFVLFLSVTCIPYSQGPDHFTALKCADVGTLYCLQMSEEFSFVHYPDQVALESQYQLPAQCCTGSTSSWLNLAELVAACGAIIPLESQNYMLHEASCGALVKLGQSAAKVVILRNRAAALNALLVLESGYSSSAVSMAESGAMEAFLHLFRCHLKLPNWLFFL
ncbi:hypothetical protein L1987_30949 [Smallanthus sonchifolius]|uniref:Uncharacterized protein n=1 Tax=Smallanthus sonchifolius TaxID=185202 RepID=A0ACB9I4W9_9ASTR|nr:hypothetical protein L1987_30949 [Smallanthus sonchifolius]